jgi:cyclic pyranopterin phosphate synthase
MAKLSHYDSAGSVHMVDVGMKLVTRRKARAHAFVTMNPATLAKLRKMENPKGNPLEIARIAGIAAAKRTSELIPLCHSLGLTHAEVKAELRPRGVRITSEASTDGRTGVEMEALVAAGVAALTVYDMCKAIDRDLEICELHVVEKFGGQSGHYVRKEKGR